MPDEWQDSEVWLNSQVHCLVVSVYSQKIVRLIISWPLSVAEVSDMWILASTTHIHLSCVTLDALLLLIKATVFSIQP